MLQVILKVVLREELCRLAGLPHGCSTAWKRRTAFERRARVRTRCGGTTKPLPPLRLPGGRAQGGRPTVAGHRERHRLNKCFSFRPAKSRDQSLMFRVRLGSQERFFEGARKGEGSEVDLRGCVLNTGRKGDTKERAAGCAPPELHVLSCPLWASKVHCQLQFGKSEPLFLADSTQTKSNQIMVKPADFHRVCGCVTSR